jgi:hypothetical protein
MLQILFTGHDEAFVDAVRAQSRHTLKFEKNRKSFRKSEKNSHVRFEFLHEVAGVVR